MTCSFLNVSAIKGGGGKALAIKKKELLFWGTRGGTAIMALPLRKDHFFAASLKVKHFYLREFSKSAYKIL